MMNGTYKQASKMKLTKLILFAVIPLFALAAHAQDCPKKDFAPHKGDFTLAATVGYNSYASVKALPGTLANYEVAALSTDWSNKKLMVGIEGGWFFKDLWKLDLGGGLNFTNNPGYSAVPGTMDAAASAEDNMGEIPSYRAVADAQTLTYNVFVGVDRYFRTKVPNLMWYTGLRVGMAYAQNQMRYDEYESMGKSIAEGWNLRGSIAMGVDYFVLPALYIGFQIEPFAYTYNMTTYKPQEGLSNLDADSHNFGFLAAPTIKIGFKF